MSGFIRSALVFSGTCPNLKFTLETKASGAYVDTIIATDASTTYQAGVCTDIRISIPVDVSGILQPDKSVRATFIRFDNGKLPFR